MFATLTQLLDSPKVASGLRAVLVLAVGLVLARLAGAAVQRVVAARFSAQHTMLARRGTGYTIVVLALVAAMREMGFDLSVLVGAAGIFTVAIGFASQTSASNIISGLFLLGERPFEVGDAIKVGATEGEVLSVDLLSAKLRTFDNTLVRIPNETLLKSEITNLSRMAIRRFDLRLGVAYHSDLAVVKAALLAVAEADPRVLDEPAPWFLLEDFGDSALLIRLAVWAENRAFFEWRAQFRMKVKLALDEAGVEIPFPQRSLSASSGNQPIPIRIVQGALPEATAAGPQTR